MFAPPKVTIRRYAASRICDVVVVVRGQEMVVRCPTYAQAVKWARPERKSYKIQLRRISQTRNPTTFHFFCVKIDIDLLLGAKHGEQRT